MMPLVVGSEGRPGTRVPAVLVSGIPCSGKTTFGNWVEAHQGGTHVNLEDDGLGRHGLRPAWDQLWLNPAAPGGFVQAVRSLRAPVVVSWGYPVECLPVVCALHEAGLEAWWFDGDPGAARASFLRRGKHLEDSYLNQMTAITQARPRITDFYGPRILTTIDAYGTYSAWDDIYERIFIRLQGTGGRAE